MLAAQANQVVSRHELIDGVWGAAVSSSAKGNLYTYVSGLRRVLGPARDLLESSAAGYSLWLGGTALDSEIFAQTQTRAQLRLSTGDYRGVVTLLDEALALWHGDAYTGVPGPFVDLERHRLAELRMSAVELRARATLRLGVHTELAAELSGLVRQYPLRESLRELLMLALQADGRYADALEAYRDAHRVLIEEQGIEPGPALRELRQRILVEAGAGKDPQPARLRVVPTHVARAIEHGDAQDSFVGRTKEIGLLRSLTSDVLAGRGRSVWIEGEPGIGKSELLAVGLANAGALGCQLAWTAADELAQRFPLQTIMECLAVKATSPDPRRAKLALELHSQTAHGGWGPSDPVPAAVDGLLALVDDACATGPLILVIDDLQWADDASVLMWHRLAATTRQLPLLLVAAARPDPGRRELAALRRGVETRGGHILTLEPLSVAETGLLIGQIVGARPGKSLRELASHAAGNPLYTREMTNALMHRNAVRLVNGIAEIDQATSDETPRSLLAAVRRTLEFLSAGTQQLLRSAAILGMEFAVGDLAAMAEKPLLDLMGALDEAVAGNVVVAEGDKLAFRHPLLRQALYESIPSQLRAVLHRRAAEMLAGSGSPVTRVAEHLVAARPDQWVACWLTDNHRAVANRAPLIAVDLLRTVLDTPLPSAHNGRACRSHWSRYCSGWNAIPSRKPNRPWRSRRYRRKPPRCGTCSRLCDTGVAISTPRSRCCGRHSMILTHRRSGAPSTGHCWPTSAAATSPISTWPKRPPVRYTPSQCWPANPTRSRRACRPCG